MNEDPVFAELNARTAKRRDSAFTVWMSAAILVLMAVAVISFVVIVVGGMRGAMQMQAQLRPTTAPIDNSYSIIDRQEGPGVKTVYVEAPTDASPSDMQGWAQEIEATEKVVDKEFMVNFYHGGRDAENMLATYQGGALYPAKTGLAPKTNVAAAAPTISHTVLYSVHGTADRALISYADGRGSLIQNSSTSLPWSRTIVTSDKPLLSLHASNVATPEDAGEVTAEIWVDGKLLADDSGQDLHVTVECGAGGCAEQR